VGHVTSPIYRGLTIQFKIFLVMSGMIMGGWIEGDRRLRRYEDMIRAQRQIARDEAVLREFEVAEERARMRAREQRAATEGMGEGANEHGAERAGGGDAGG
jgi:hypothetical protein